ncbi:hypothetical protein EMIHUDRAFT_421620 [Emiliania huxleyi CCMP1516]|uniref:Uncharacterized protein n=2 Tax=Emiliania huxleyi TaxID=2903 RepID=A0A0D3IZI7_EMIH1|nr:hypothetical protein EMIHUDRAFT_459106 [Emiliania huxleyi CCMP1516]XP_005772968.1 hypothetical protein EMIHUDRAFT_421620 [Emiliania huxleyi CCMP1516]EOD16672.1 hypothetical protein EMIHUDRAFT_459106 [Emiliania huxleyi CCMP1516]EOD20539.1 hypothetical protein EMIHUDRAFT_421620 [Emiliania huxleyi CCMP1516]|eukprot:XP_005769101.1 hypothetical protein EMIHUDRAFT_459106 [Emiliania huxleyi CCMP1516]
MKALLVLISTACAASALQLQARPPAPRTRLRVLAAPRLAESAEPESTPATPEPLTISDEQIAAAARAASEPGADPFAGFETAEPPREEEPFDPRIIIYVSLPALVLGAQLFFTFSRDMLAGDQVGPAVMDAM